MSRATPDDQLKFLLSCVRYSNNGKIDFVEVAKECGVVSKGAAAKRYERLLKANGIHPNGGQTEKATNFAPKQKSRAEIARAADAKRRKIENEAYDYQDDDEEDIKPFFKPEPFDMAHIKPEPGAGFQVYPWSPIPAPPQQPFFSRPPITQMTSPQAFRQPFLPAYHNSPHRFPHPVSQPIHPLTSQGLSQPTPRSGASPMSVTQPRDTTIRPLSPPAISEDQINSMFEEFCSQDMFKQPNFDLVSSAQSSTRLGNPSTSSPGGEAHMSPRTISTTATPVTSDGGVALPVVKQETLPTTAQASETPIPVDQLMGTGFKNSILIAD